MFKVVAKNSLITVLWSGSCSLPWEAPGTFHKPMTVLRLSLQSESWRHAASHSCVWRLVCVLSILSSVQCGQSRQRKEVLAIRNHAIFCITEGIKHKIVINLVSMLCISKWFSRFDERHQVFHEELSWQIRIEYRDGMWNQSLTIRGSACLSVMSSHLITSDLNAPSQCSDTELDI